MANVKAFIDEFRVKGVSVNRKGKAMMIVEVICYRLLDNGKTKITRDTCNLLEGDTISISNGDEDGVKKLKEMQGIKE